MLHEEHVAVLDLLQRLTSLLNRHGPASPPDPETARPLLAALAAAIGSEIGTHFDFEERFLFPVLDANGESELTELYIAEHRVIVPLGAKVAALAEAARELEFDTGRWSEIHQVAGAFADHLTRHAESEEAALVPLLDDQLDPETDDRLAREYEALR